jgi:uncharacterized protein (TIGR02246 family)
MRNIAPLTGLLLILAGAASGADFKASPEDEKAVRQVIKDFNDADNDHDGKALAGLFDADGDLLTPAGERLSGPAQIESSVKAARIWSESSPALMRSIRVRFLRPDVAVVDTERAIYSSTGGFAHHLTFLLTKDDGRWRIASCRYAPSEP